MKYKIIALAVSAALLSGCGSDNHNEVIVTEVTTLQAFDGAVRYLDTYISCDDGQSFDFVGETGGKGIISLSEGNFPLFDADPTQCTFTFQENLTGSGGIEDAIDESNGKDMTNVSYTVPSELIIPGQPIAGTPYTTLIDRRIQEAGEGYDLATIIDEVFTATLPPNTILTTEQKMLLLTDPQAALDSMDPRASKNVQASTMALSDALIGGDAQSLDDIENVTQTIATSLAGDEDFPIDLSSDLPTYIDVSEELKDPTTFQALVIATPDYNVELPVGALEIGVVLEEIPPTVIPPPEEELPPPTGGTGATGG